MSTTFKTKCEILGEFWVRYSDDEYFEELFINCNVGFPLAFMIDSKLANPTDEGKGWIEDTWRTFCASLKLDKDDEHVGLHYMLHAGADDYQYYNPDFPYTE